MRFVDAHIHLSDPEYDQKVSEIVEDAKKSNVVALVSNSMNLQTSILSLQLAKDYPNLVYAALGIHPWSVRQLSVNEIQNTVDLILQHAVQESKVVAVGEIGLDYQYAKRKELQDGQIKVFHEMLCVAEKLSLPVIIHSRGTAPQIMSLLPHTRWGRFSSTGLATPWSCCPRSSIGDTTFLRAHHQYTPTEFETLLNRRRLKIY